MPVQDFLTNFTFTSLRLLSEQHDVDGFVKSMQSDLLPHRWCGLSTRLFGFMKSIILFNFFFSKSEILYRSTKLLLLYLRCVILFSINFSLLGQLFVLFSNCILCCDESLLIVVLGLQMSTPSLLSTMIAWVKYYVLFSAESLSLIKLLFLYGIRTV